MLRRPRPSPRGITTTYTYDAENQLTSKTYSDSTPAAYYYYDESSVTVNGQGYTLANGKGRLTHTSADNGQAITVTDYDPVGRLDDFWQCTPFNCASGKLWDERYGYYPDGKINTEVRAEGYYVSYGVGNDGRYNAINNGLTGPNYPQQLAVIYYAPQGAVSEIEHQCAGTGCTENVQLYDYNNRLELVRSRLGSGSNATSIDCVVYNYYGNEANPTSCAIPSQGTGDDGNVLGKFYQDNVNASLSHTTSMSYDPTHRLTGAAATGSSTYNLAFAYDQFGNMTCQTNGQTQGLCPQYSFSSSTNRITSSGYTYDASGDLTGDGAHTYQYDAEGRLVSVDNGSTASYVYNALGERVEKDVGGAYTEYLFDKDGNPEAENNRGSSNGGWVDSWVYFQGQHIAHFENGGVYYIYSNQVGTAGFVTDWTGTVVQDELHYPWGQVWTMMGTQTEERFASLHHRDSATNLDPTHFRMYSSNEARWLTPDPAQADIYNPQSMSRYAYAGGNPLAFADPTGLDSCWDYSSYEGSGGPPVCSSGPTYYGAPVSYTMDGVDVPASVAQGALSGGFAAACGIYCGENSVYEGNLVSLQHCDATEGGWSCNQTTPTYLGLSLQQFQAAYYNQLDANAAALASELASKGDPNAFAQANAFMQANYSPDWASVANEGGNFDFPQITGSYNFASLQGCQFERCDLGFLGTLDFSHNGTFHLDSGDPWNFPSGTASHFTGDIVGGNFGGFVRR